MGNREPVRIRWIRLKAGPAATAASAILAAEALSWLCYAYRYVNAQQYYACCGAGRMFGYTPIHTTAAIILAGSALTLAAAPIAATGRRSAARACWVVCLLGVLDGLARVITPTTSRQSTWNSPPPWWFTAVERGWPTLIGCSAALVLLLCSPILRMLDA